MVRMPDSERSSGWLPALLCLAAAVVLWWIGEGWREDRRTSEGQAQTARRLLAHRDTASADALEAQRRVWVARKQALTSRLGTTDSSEMARAQLVYDVRERCYEIKLHCQVRLTESVVASASVAAGASAAAAGEPDDPLAELGIQRVRAVVTGILTGQDAFALPAVFQHDPQHQWKVNRIQFKGKSFEMDVERLLMAAGR